MTSSINYIVIAVPHFGGLCTITSASSANLELPVQLVDGRTLNYSLVLQQQNTTVSVREKSPNYLPSFCPERHINRDGTFCLNYSEANVLTISNESSAVKWLETLYKFLILQERARTKRKWPNQRVWAHGEAAHYQLRAFKAATSLNTSIAEATAENLVTIARKRSIGRSILEVRSSDIPVYRVWEFKGRVINQKQSCFCGTSGNKRPKKLRNCGSHSKNAYDLAMALRDWENAEAQYWREMKGSSCCETCDVCPLKNAT